MTDYTVTLQDATGRTCTLFISADSIREMLDFGLSLDDAKEGLESNAFEKAVRDGEISASAELITRSH